MTNTKAQELRNQADRAKYLHMTGEITYELALETCKEYIDYCNERAVAISKEFGMKPKKMSVKAFMR